MKTFYYSMLFWLSLSWTITAVAQEPSKILKVSYTTNSVSDFLIKMLKAHSKDPEEYAKIIGKASEHRLYHSLYQNVETQESIYVLDSIHEVPGVNTTGHCTYVFKDATQEIQGAELFVGKKVKFKGSMNALEWDITNETTTINGLSCIKATLKTNPEIYVWFTLEIPIAAGPYLYTNLPGLVLESNSFFQSTTALQVAYEKDTKAFETALQQVKKELQSKNAIPIEEVLIKKQNFRRMAEKGKS